MNFDSARGLHDTATYLTLKKRILSFGSDFFSQRELVFSQNHYIIGRNKRTLGERRKAYERL